jgi:hypothetical protein
MNNVLTTGKAQEKAWIGISRPQALSGMLSLGCNRSSFHPLPLCLARNMVKNTIYSSNLA